MHERNLSIATKGKAKETVRWHLGWWDLCHSLEGTKRPVQWSKSSVIFTSHESQAVIIARHFPSSRQFLLPTPPLDLSSYDPATVLSICPTDDWLFAYFPGKSAGGMGCVWRKETQVDSWSLRETWHYVIGGGVVTAVWTSSHRREWIVSDAGTSSRLPPLGPPTPVAAPLLLLVTECHLLHVHNFSASGRSAQPTRAPLLQPIDIHPPGDPDPVGKVGGDKICVKAAIGLSYSHPSILVAMRSQLLPPMSSTPAFPDLGLPVETDQPSVAEWELWGEEQMISLCEVRIEYRPNVPPVMSRPLPPLYYPSSRLVDLVFYCPPPSRPSTPPGKVEQQRASYTNPALFLIASYFDMGDYTSVPKSEIVCYTFLSTPQPPPSHWMFRAETKRSNQTKVPCFLMPSVVRGGLIVGFLDAGGLLSRRKPKTKEIATGAMEIIKLPELATNAEWESAPIHSHVGAGTVDVPISVALSPNEALVCCFSSPLLGSQLSIQALPRRLSGDSSLAALGNLHGDLSRHLVTAVRARYSPSDVIHALSLPSLPTEVTVNTLYHAFTTMEADSFGLMEMWTGELLGIAMEVYSERTQRLEMGADQDLCASRWKTAHEIASISACCGAFDTCREGDVYDLDAVWQLLALTEWIVEFVERVFKESIFIGERPEPEPLPATPTIQFPDSRPPTVTESPIFLHLVHPYALGRIQTAVEHVKRFYDQVSRLPSKGETSQIAKDVLIDATEGSGIDLQLVGALLADIMQECKKLDAQDLRRSLASCGPVPALKPHIRKVIDKILTSKAIDRARLFIKPSDLSDGITRLNLSELGASSQPGTLREKSVDVVKKGMLPRHKIVSVCVRCGGRSELGTGTKVEGVSSRWQTWERTWQLRCVCGGSWSSAM